MNIRAMWARAARRAAAFAALLLVAGCAGTAGPGRLASIQSLGGTHEPQDAAEFVDLETARKTDQLALLETLGVPLRNGHAAPVPSPDPDGIRARLGEGRALLVYRLGEPHTSMWAINADTWRRFELPAASEIEARIDSLRWMLAHDAMAGSPGALRVARRLYMMLVSSAEPLLAGRELVIVPDGALWLLPFEALMTVEPERNGKIPRRGWLVQNWNVAYAVSAEAAAAERDPRIRGGVVALGDPLYDDPDAGNGGTTVAALPRTAMELAELDEEARDRERVALVGVEATRFGLQAEPLVPDAGLLHLATHAVAVDDAPARSGLWLGADTTGHADFMSATEIIDLDLRAQLVVLTQSETSAPGTGAGRGVRALSGAFFAAGVERVALSHWKPLNRATSILIERFYRNLLRKDLGATAALADAKREMLKKSETRTPHLWAPIVLVQGEAGE